jgi:hydroxymethylpyrimidine pyrophosphatase-like HAD family hydrolase
MHDLGAVPHDEEYQTPFKASYALAADAFEHVRDAIRTLKKPCRVVFSSGKDLDILPPETGKGHAASYCLARFSAGRTRSVGAGDSGNDVELLRATDCGVVVGNGDEDLRRAVDPTRTFMATQPFADGLIEGLRHWGAFHVESSRVIPTV